MAREALWALPTGLQFAGVNFFAIGWRQALPAQSFCFQTTRHSTWSLQAV
jgi:hypothetical protein